MRARFSGNLEIDQTSLSRLPSAVSSQFARALNQKIKRGLPRLQTNLREKIKEVILGSPEVQLIINDDDIRGQIGLPNPQKRFSKIADAIASSLFVVSRPFRAHRDTLSGRLEIYAAPSDNKYLYELSQSYVGGETNELFQWLRAICEAGNEIFITGYAYFSKILSDKSKAKYSRSGRGLMLARGSKTWKVPTEISGNLQSNFITRSLESREMRAFINREFERLLF